MQRILYLVLALTLGLGFSSCKKDTPTTTTDPAQSTALTSGYWEYEHTSSSGAHYESTRIWFKPDGTYTFHHLAKQLSGPYKDDLSSQFNDEFYASGRYSVTGNQVKFETFQFDRYADRFIGHRDNEEEEGLAVQVLIFDQQAQTLTSLREASSEGGEGRKEVLYHKH